jgi:uncharacterized membrane protein
VHNRVKKIGFTLWILHLVLIVWCLLKSDIRIRRIGNMHKYHNSKAHYLITLRLNWSVFLRVYGQCLTFIIVLLLAVALSFVIGSGITLMINTINDQVISILTLAGSTSYDKTLILEDAFNQNMLGSFLLVSSFHVALYSDATIEMSV